MNRFCCKPTLVLLRVISNRVVLKARFPQGAMLHFTDSACAPNLLDRVATTIQRGRLPLPGTVLVVSGRAGFELVQKASTAGIPAMVAVSAPSTLAVDLAVEAGITLAGFARGDSMVVYAGEHRLRSAAAPAR